MRNYRIYNCCWLGKKKFTTKTKHPQDSLVRLKQLTKAKLFEQISHKITKYLVCCLTVQSDLCLVMQLSNESIKINLSVEAAERTINKIANQTVLLIFVNLITPTLAPASHQILTPPPPAPMTTEAVTVLTIFSLNLLVYLEIQGLG